MPNEQTARAVAQWLRDLSRISGVLPVRLTFDYSQSKLVTHRKTPEVCYGAYYCFTGEYTADMMGCQRGEHKPGDTYEEWRYYLLGKQPRGAKHMLRVHDGLREHRIIYKLGDDTGDWYLSSYMQEPIKPEFAQYHPFGPSFQLGRWPHEKFGQRIDHYDPKPGMRERVPVRVETLTE